MMTAQQVAESAKHAKPHVRYAYGIGCVAAYSEADQRWKPVAGQLIGSGEWYSLPYELLINGKPVPQEWIEVTL